MVSTIKPLLLKGHTRPLTKVCYNREGDLLFSCSKDGKPTAWYVDNGERLGTYNGHEGAVWDCDVNFSTSKLLTGSADQTARLWDVETGKMLFSFKHKSGVRSVRFAHGERMCLTVQDNTFNTQPAIFIHNLQEDLSTQSDDPVRTFVPGADKPGDKGEKAKINTALWGALNRTIISCDDDGVVRQWDVENSKQTKQAQEHKKAIASMQFSKDQTMFVTASHDHTAKLWDAKTLKVLKTYNSDRPINAAAISPLKEHVIIGGGQEAMNVTVTSSKVGHFEVDFFQMVYMDFLGNVKGHFGPVHTLAFSPDGTSFASGSEDGYIRLHHLDKTYQKMTDKY